MKRAASAAVNAPKYSAPSSVDCCKALFAFYNIPAREVGRKPPRTVGLPLVLVKPPLVLFLWKKTSRRVDNDARCGLAGDLNGALTLLALHMLNHIEHEDQITV